MSQWLPLLSGMCGALVALAVLWPLRRTGRRGMLVMSTCSGVIAAMLYLLLGTPQALQQARDPQHDDLLRGVQELQQALREHPGRGDGWALLGRSQLELGQPLQAAHSFQRAVQLLPDDAGVLVEAAQARAQADAGRRFDDQALAWLQHALQVDPAAERAAWLIGVALRQRGRDAEAADIWESLLPRLQPAAADALRQQIAVARDAAGTPTTPTDAAAAPSGPHAITVQLTLDPAWPAAASLPDDSTVFVIARQPGDSPMPVAVKRIALRDLPLTLSLGDGDAAMPTLRLSQLQQVEVLARISRSGQIGADDISGTSAPVPLTLPHAAPVSVRIGPP